MQKTIVKICYLIYYISKSRKNLHQKERRFRINEQLWTGSTGSGVKCSHDIYRSGMLFSVRGRTCSKIAGDNSEEGESTTEVTTEKKEESTTATESQESQTSSERDTSSGNKEHSQTEHTTESTKRNTSGTSGNTDQAEDTDSSTSDTSGNSSHSNEEGTTQKKAKKDISSREDAEIRTKAIKKITDQLAEKDAPDGSDKTSTFIPKIYNDTRLAMKNNKECIF